MRKVRKINWKKSLIIVSIVIAALFLVALLLEVFGIIDFYHNSSPQTSDQKAVDTIDYSPAKPSDNNDINKAKQEGSINKQVGTKPITITLTRVYQDISKSLVVRTLVEGQNSGTCKLELSQNGGAPSFSKEAPISQQNNIFSCDGFNITNAEFVGLGEWTVKVTANGGGTSNSASQNIILEK